MSEFSDNARVTIFLADHVQADPQGKVYALGIGFTVTGVTPQGTSAPSGLCVIIELPAQYAGREFATSVELVDETTGQTSTFSTPDGRREALRIQQMVTLQRTQGEVQSGLPADFPVRGQQLYNFPFGVEVVPGHAYRWVFQIDGQTRHDWSAYFCVPGPAAGPIIGGPVGGSSPTDLPRL